MLEIQVNGIMHTVAAAPETALLYVLRNELNLTGPKFGCGLGQCGACTVHLNGQPLRSCIVPVSSVAGAAVTTLEGLSAEYYRSLGIPHHGQLHPLQKAFIDEQAAQCGYCTNGMIMTGAALLRKARKINDNDLRAAMSGNLCRCGSHLRILRALRRAADAEDVD